MIPINNKNAFSLFDDNKVVLRASQLLEEINRLTAETVSKKEDESSAKSIFLRRKVPSAEFKQLLLLQTRLKQLLHQRYALTLRAAYSRAITDSENLYKECWLVVESEKIKLKSIPALGYSTCADGHYFDLSCKMFPDKLIQVEQQWYAIERSFQKTLSLFHAGFNYELSHMFESVSSTSSLLIGQLMFIVSIFLNICLEKLCTLDPSSLSSEFVTNIMSTCDNFTELCSKWKICNVKCCIDIHTFDSYSTEVTWKNLMNLIASFQSNIAANKVVSTLVPSMQKVIKDKNLIFEMNWFPEESLHSTGCKPQTTSDYASASCSETQDMFCKAVEPKEVVFVEVNSRLLSALNSIVHKNQALLLKYVFGVKSSSKSEKKKTIVNERIYWKDFWKKTESSSFRMLMEVPNHHHGDTLGPMITWEKTFQVLLLKTLKLAYENDDLSPDGQTCLKNLFSSILSFISVGAWDKSFHCAIKDASNFRYVTVPVADGNLATKPGLSFCISVGPVLGAALSYHWPCGKLDLFKAIYGLITTLDAFRNWVLSRQRALLSSLNVSAYLTIAHSDVVRFQSILNGTLLSEIVAKFSEHLPHYEASILSIAYNYVQNICLDIEASTAELPLLMKEKMSKLLYKNYHQVKRFHLCSICRSDVGDSYASMDCIIETVLVPVYEATVHFETQKELNSKVFDKVVFAITQTLLDLLEHKLSSSQFHILLNDVHKFLKWIATLPVEDKNCILSPRCREKLITLNMIHEAEEFRAKRRWMRANRVVPLSPLHASS